MAPAAPEVEYDRVQDLPTSGFAAPVRGTNITGDDGLPPHVLESTDTMARLDDLLSSLSTGMDGWDGDRIFAPGGGVGRTGAGRRKQAGGSTHAGGAGGADDHADWSRDGAGYFGGTAADYDAGVAPGGGMLTLPLTLTLSLTRTRTRARQRLWRRVWRRRDAHVAGARGAGARARGPNANPNPNPDP